MSKVRTLSYTVDFTLVTTSTGRSNAFALGAALRALATLMSDLDRKDLDPVGDHLLPYSGGATIRLQTPAINPEEEAHDPS